MSTQTTCKNCNATLDEGTVFCPMCGTKREVASPPEKNVFCSKCGKPSGAELAFCQECGNPLRENAEAVTSNNNNEPKKDIKGMLKKPIFLVIPAAVIVLILLIALVIKPKGSSHLIYVKDKELQYSHLSKKREVIDDDEYAIKHQQYSLYYWNKGKETLVASDVDPYSFSTSTNVSAVVYQKHNTAPIETKKLSEITSGDDDYDSGYYYIYELQDKIRESRSLSDDKFVAIEEKEATLECNNARNLKINKEGAIYFLNDYNDEKYYGDLMSAVIKNGAVEKPVKIDDDVMGYQFGNENNIILYYKDVKNEAGDVYMNNKFMASDVYIPSLYNFKGKNKLLYYIDYSDKSQSGTLYLYDNDSVVKISDDVSFLVPINDKDIAYLIDYRFDREKGDLMLYNGKKKPTPIDSDVTALLWNPKMFWHNNWYYYY